MTEAPLEMWKSLDATFRAVDRAIDQHCGELRSREIGVVVQVGRGVAEVVGLPSVRADELLKFSGNLLGLAFNLDEDAIGCVLLDDNETLQAGSEAQRTGRVLNVPVGEELLGRVIDPVGRPLDGRGSLHALLRLPCERNAPAIMDRAPVTVPLQTGLKVIDALIPIGRGQRELILGDRQTGKTAVAVDTIINQQGQDVICIYCSIGRRSTSVARVIEDLRRHGALEYCVVVVGESDTPPGLQYTAPYAATTIGEHFMQQGRDVLVVYDDLTSHARAYRELSLLLRRPPGREAFPGDIFYIHSRLLERSTHLRDEAGGGSLTALPIVETEAQNVSAYIPTNLISITDGQIYLSPDLFRKSIMPAADVGRSVSRVGGKTQLPAYPRRGRRPATRVFAIRRTGKVRPLQQPARPGHAANAGTWPACAGSIQTAAAQTDSRARANRRPGCRHPRCVRRSADREIRDGERAVREAMTRELPQLCDQIIQGEPLSDEDLEAITRSAERAVSKC